MIDRRNPLIVPALASLALALLAAIWTVSGRMHAAGVLAIAGEPTTRDHFIVTLDFAPEAFHTTRMQDIGRVIEVRGSDVYMMDVDPAALRGFATAYWVREVRKWPGR